MAVAKFATNNLVREHDIYVDFMRKRAEYFKDSENPEFFKTAPLWYKRGILNRGMNGFQQTYRAINKWHCIMISYRIWCELAASHVTNTVSATSYKQIVNVPTNVLVKFKDRVEEEISAAGCDYNSKSSHVTNKYDACRYLAMFWTYLDIIKDEKTPRYFPNKITATIAAEVFE